MSSTALVPDTPGMGSQIRSRRTELGISQAQLAEQVGVHALTVSAWERNAKAPTESRLEQIAKALKTTPAALRYGEGDAASAYTPRPTTRRRLPPRVYEVVHEYLARMERAGCTEEQLDEAERLMVDFNYSKLHKTDARERSEDEQITDVRAIWSAIEESLRDDGVKL